MLVVVVIVIVFRNLRNCRENERRLRKLPPSDSLQLLKFRSNRNDPERGSSAGLVVSPPGVPFAPLLVVRFNVCQICEYLIGLKLLDKQEYLSLDPRFLPK